MQAFAQDAIAKYHTVDISNYRNSFSLRAENAKIPDQVSADLVSLEASLRVWLADGCLPATPSYVSCVCSPGHFRMWLNLLLLWAEMAEGV